MTKMKSKKMTKSTFAIIIMAIAMVAMLAFGGTYAYFTASANKNEVSGIKTAVVQISNKTANATLAAAVKNKNLLPGDAIFGVYADDYSSVTTYEKVAIESTSTVATYLFVSMEAVTIVGDDEVALVVGTNAGESVLVVDIKNAWTPVRDTESKIVAYYTKVDAADETTTKIDKDFEFAVRFHEGIHADRTENEATIDETTNVFVKGGAAADIMGVNVKITIEVSAIQQKGYTEATDMFQAYTDSTSAVNTRS